MASRERKRVDRRKRKKRTAERRVHQEARRDAMAARSEARNEAARAALEPLAPGERPAVVTIGAVISAVIAISTILGYAAGVEVTRIGSDGIEQGEDQAPILSVIVVVALMGTMAWGMWRARYWAVLGFQALLVLVLVAASLGLAQVTELWRGLAFAAVLGVAGFLFYKMVKAMARIQMPRRPSSE